MLDIARSHHEAKVTALSGYDSLMHTGLDLPKSIMPPQISHAGIINIHKDHALLLFHVKSKKKWKGIGEKNNKTRKPNLLR